MGRIVLGKKLEVVVMMGWLSGIIFLLF